MEIKGIINFNSSQKTEILHKVAAFVFEKSDILQEHVDKHGDVEVDAVEVGKVLYEDRGAMAKAVAFIKEVDSETFNENLLIANKNIGVLDIKKQYIGLEKTFANIINTVPSFDTVDTIVINFMAFAAIHSIIKNNIEKND